jgi:hypothetical protein
MEIMVLDHPVGNVIARGSYFGGPDYEFMAERDGHVYFRVVGDKEMIWAGPDAETFRRIAAAWNRCQQEVLAMPTEATEECRLQRIAEMREELRGLGALPSELPTDPEPFWSLLIFEAENELG